MRVGCESSTGLGAASAAHFFSTPTSVGTGCVKITPAHDFNDFDVGKRHDLEMINILERDGTINAVGGELFAGLDRFEAREKVKDELEKLGLTSEHLYTVKVGATEW